MMLSVACGPGVSQNDEPTPKCAPNEIVKPDGSCSPPQDPPPKGCAAGEIELADKTCRRAGIMPGACGKGFTHDGDRGCKPILPEAPCPGKIAVPGDAACREIAPCGPGAYPELPNGAKVQYVDGGYGGGNSDGTLAKPWTKIQQAIDAAESGSAIAIAAGKYGETLTIAKTLSVRGVCPGMVEIAGSGKAAIVIGAGASKTEIRGVALRGLGAGVAIEGAQEVRIDAVWIHDTAGEGVLATGSVTLSASLIERSTGYGVSLRGASALVDGCAVRDVKAGKFLSAGISARRDFTTKKGSVIDVRGSLVEIVPDVGIEAKSSELSVENSVIRDLAPNESGYGDGIDIQSDGFPAKLTLKTSLIERAVTHGVVIGHAEASIEATVVRGTKPVKADELSSGIIGGSEILSMRELELSVKSTLIEDVTMLGIIAYGGKSTLESVAIRDVRINANGMSYGAYVTSDLDTQKAGSLTMTGCAIERTAAYGVSITSATASIDRTLISDLAKSAPEAGGGIIGNGFGKQPTDITVTRSLIDGARAVGIWALGSTVLVEDTTLRNMRPYQNGVGAGLAANSAGKALAKLTARRTTVDGSIGFGVGVFDASQALLEDVVIRNTAANGMVQGDGIAVVSANATASITGTRVEKSARAAIANFGAKVSIGTSKLVCQSFDLDGEPFKGVAFSFQDLGDNGCGCPDPLKSCKATSEKLAPPDPLPLPTSAP
jgi:hypothetical protein